MVRAEIGQVLESRLGHERTDRVRSLEARVRRTLTRTTLAGRTSGASLTELAARFGTDKWGVHRYTPHYEACLQHLREERFTLVEIGVGGFTQAGRGGDSLRMWKAFFPRAQIVGLDIADKREFAERRIDIHQGDQSDPVFLRDVAARYPDLKVVIDDGSHVPAHVRASFEVLFPLLPDDGIYCIEDLQTSYWPSWGGQLDPAARGTSMALVKDLIDGLNHEEFLVEGYRPSYTDRHVTAVHAWHNLVIVEKGDNREGSNRETAADQPYYDPDGPAPVQPPPTRL